MTPRPLRLVISDHIFSQLLDLRGPISIPVYVFLDSATLSSSCSSFSPEALVVLSIDSSRLERLSIERDLPSRDGGPV